MRIAALLVLAVATIGVAAADESTAINDYRLKAVIEPATGRLEVSASIKLVNDGRIFEFLLASSLDIVPGVGVNTLEVIGPVTGAVPLTRYRMHRVPGNKRIELRYAGEISHRLADRGEGYGRSFESTPGIIDSTGVYLSAASGWFPLPTAEPLLYRFDLTVDLPAGWDAVSQGKPGGHRKQGGRVQVGWQESQAQDDIYLVAAPWTRYQRASGVEPLAAESSGVAAGEVLAQAFLRSPDPVLAERYLDATGRYVDLYSRLLGPYPYAKFALVENFWESGYGMPSFTLLGPRVLRLPFIIHTSYPHEVLHNWWGNGVYVDYQGGNWSEGLTAYLSDHLFKAMRGKGAEYRRDALQRYRDFVGEQRDFPLSEFRGRHGPISQAVGYGKALMVFHMLRKDIGDKAFLAGLRSLYSSYRFRFASWADIQVIMEAVSGRNLAGFFGQWLRRAGAPRLALSRVAVGQGDDGWRLSGRLAQEQAGDVYGLRVPVLIQTAANGLLERRVLDLRQRKLNFSFDLAARPLRLMVDPGFDVFRLLDSQEVPAALSGLFGSPRPLVILPANGPDNAAWRSMVAGWAARGGQWEVVADDELQTLPEGRSVLLLGWDNRFRTHIPEALVGSGSGRTTVAGETVSPQQDALVVVASHPNSDGKVVAWIAAADAAQLPALARKLPHYGKYGYLVFRGGAVRLKGQWPVANSPLWVTLPGGDAAAAPQIPAEQALTALIEAATAGR